MAVAAGCTRQGSMSHKLHSDHAHMGERDEGPVAVAGERDEGSVAVAGERDEGPAAWRSHQSSRTVQ